MLNFPSAGLYTGYQYTAPNNIVYTYDGSKWVGENSPVAGYTGSQGTSGFTGSTGADGGQGFIGSTGIGYTGSTGDQGIQGPFGAQGPQGYFGSQGPRGDQGYTGSASDVIGYIGSQGDIGYTGSQGDIGYTGSQGYGFEPRAGNGTVSTALSVGAHAFTDGIFLGYQNPGAWSAGQYVTIADTTPGSTLVYYGTLVFVAQGVGTIGFFLDNIISLSGTPVAETSNSWLLSFAGPLGYTGSQGAAVPQAITSTTGTSTATNLTVDLSGPTFIHWQPSANGNRTITLTGFTPGRKVEVFITPHTANDIFTVSGVTTTQCSNGKNTFTMKGVAASQQSSFILQIYCTTNAIGGVWIYGIGSL